MLVSVSHVRFTQLTLLYIYKFLCVRTNTVECNTGIVEEPG